MKTCSKCKIKKELDEFYKDKTIKSGRRASCKFCCSKDRRGYLKKYYQNNKEYLSAKSKKWRESNPEKCKEYNRKHYEARDKEEERKRLREYSRTLYRRQKNLDNRRKWRKNNPYKVKAEKHRRRVLEQTGTFTDKELHQLFEFYNYQCLSCGDNDNLTVDHVVPLSKGGLNLIDNIQPLCLSCNTSKGAKTIDYRVNREVA